MVNCFGSSSKFTKSDIITIKNGPIQGKTFSFAGGKQVDAFLGIPYAKPPVGELRFKKPEPSDSWGHVKDCTKFRPSCPYEDFKTDKIFIGQKVKKHENCLHLNVFAPKWKTGKDQPNGHAVLVWIHGGGFQIHTSEHYGDYGICKGLCTKDVIVVTINYRLGFFGFFTTGDENAKGNIGLWDQTLALKWVKDNITTIGGDPNNITVFGHSAGGMSVDFLALSPHSRDLFQKMYCLGGTGYAKTIFRTSESIRNAGLEFAKQLGFKLNEDDITSIQNVKLVDFLMKLPAEKLSIGMDGKKGFKINKGGIELGPYIDGDFFPKSLDELRKEMPKKVALNGVTDKEGIFFYNMFNPQGPLQPAIEALLTNILTMRKVKNVEEAKKKLLIVYYKGVDKNDPKQLQKVYVDLVGEAFLSYPSFEFNHEMALNGHTVYQYVFEYVHPKTFGKLKVPLIKASHGTELPYIFGKKIFSNFFPKQLNEMRMQEMVTTYVTNFAKYGNPNGLRKPTGEFWEPVDPEKTHRYFKINLPFSMMQENIHQGRMKAWHQVLQEDKLYH